MATYSLFIVLSKLYHLCSCLWGVEALIVMLGRLISPFLGLKCTRNRKSSLSHIHNTFKTFFGRVVTTAVNLIGSSFFSKLQLWNIFATIFLPSPFFNSPQCPSVSIFYTPIPPSQQICSLASSFSFFFHQS